MEPNYLMEGVLKEGAVGEKIATSSQLTEAGQREPLFSTEKDLRRLKICMEKVMRDKKEHWAFVKDGRKMYLVIEGRKVECDRITGYIQLPTQKVWIPVMSMDSFILYFLPCDKMLVETNEGIWSRGYKNQNTEGFLILLYAISNSYEMTIIDTGEPNTKPVIQICEVTDKEDDTLDRRIVEQLMYLFSKRDLENRGLETNEENEGGWDE